MKNKLTTNLVNCRFTRAPGIEHAWPSAFKPSMDGQYTATVVAAWIDKDGVVKVLARDPHGNMAEFWPTNALYVDGAK